LVAFSKKVGADQLATLLRPYIIAAAVDPRCPDGPAIGVVVIARAAHDRSVAVAGQRDGKTLAGISNCASADQLWPLLRELRQRELR
jgi:hypothetical protein